MCRKTNCYSTVSLCVLLHEYKNPRQFRFGDSPIILSVLRDLLRGDFIDTFNSISSLIISKIKESVLVLKNDVVQQFRVDSTQLLQLETVGKLTALHMNVETDDGWCQLCKQHRALGLVQIQPCPQSLRV